MSKIDIKILLVGSRDTGKNSLIHQYIYHKFNNNYYLSTIGLNFLFKAIKIDNQEVLLKIVDTTGQEKYRSLLSNCFRKVDGIILVFDITNKSSFEDIEEWLLVINRINRDIKKILVGNKIDLVNCREINKENAEKYAERRNMKYFEVSDKTGENVEEAFSTLVRLILNSEKNINEKTNTKNKVGKKEFEIDNKTNNNHINLNSDKDFKKNKLYKFLNI